MLGEKYTLNIFTNLSDVDADKIPLKATLESFKKTFTFENVHAVNIFIHPKPFSSTLLEFKRCLRDWTEGLPLVRIQNTTGLAHGYAKSILISETAYCFQLEHDWLSHKEHIHHTDQQIIGAMKSAGMDHLRFNKGPNVEIPFDAGLREEMAGDLVVCRTPGCSNNPHFIARKAYLEKYLHLIDVGAPAATGIEELLYGVPTCFIYGPLGHPATLDHMDGRVGMRELRRRLGRTAFRFIVNRGLAGQALRFQDLLTRPRHMSGMARGGEGQSLIGSNSRILWMYRAFHRTSPTRIVLFCLVLASAARAEAGDEDRRGLTGAQPRPASTGVTPWIGAAVPAGLLAQLKPLQETAPTRDGAKAQLPQSSSAACNLVTAQKEALDGALGRLVEEAKTLPDDDPLRCDALRRTGKVAEWRQDIARQGASCGVTAFDAQMARRVAEVKAKIAACPPVTAGACAISTRQFVSAMQDVLQESALSIYANTAASGKEVCRFVGVMRGVLIEARADAEVIERSCNQMLATGTDDERGLLIALTEARQKVERHDIAIKPKIAACSG